MNCACFCDTYQKNQLRATVLTAITATMWACIGKGMLQHPQAVMAPCTWRAARQLRERELDPAAAGSLPETPAPAATPMPAATSMPAARQTPTPTPAATPAPTTQLPRSTFGSSGVSSWKRIDEDERARAAVPSRRRKTNHADYTTRALEPSTLEHIIAGDHGCKHMWQDDGEAHS